jgi:hypothetical protein
VHTVAYLDSGSVSMVASAIVAGFAGIAVIIKMGFRRFLSLFSPTQRAALKAEKAAKQEREAAAASAAAATTPATGPEASQAPAS